MQSVVELYVEVQDWEEAFLWADKHPEYRQLVYVPYATSLAEQDKFLQAQKGMAFIILKWRYTKDTCLAWLFLIYPSIYLIFLFVFIHSCN